MQAEFSTCEKGENEIKKIIQGLRPADAGSNELFADFSGCGVRDPEQRNL